MQQQMLTSSDSFLLVLHLNHALVHKYRPKTLEKVLVYQVIAQNFKKLMFGASAERSFVLFSNFLLFYYF
ncbi:hypothetical protein Hanom_Chr07g00631181 [Helianthus anomalus]